MEAFEVGREEEGCAVEFGKGVGCFDDGVAKAREDGAVEGVEDGVLEDDVLDVVFLACGWIWISLWLGGGGRCVGHWYLVSRGW